MLTLLLLSDGLTTYQQWHYSILCIVMHSSRLTYGVKYNTVVLH